MAKRYKYRSSDSPDLQFQYPILILRLSPVKWSGNQLVAATLSSDYSGETRQILVELTGFTSAGAGKLIGPNGNEMDTEEFLSSLQVYYTVTGSSDNTYLNYNVVTQKYGKGIVEYGSKESTTFPGGDYYDVCDATGKIYLSWNTQK